MIPPRRRKRVRDGVSTDRRIPCQYDYAPCPEMSTIGHRESMGYARTRSENGGDAGRFIKAKKRLRIWGLHVRAVPGAPLNQWLREKPIGRVDFEGNGEGNDSFARKREASLRSPKASRSPPLAASMFRTRTGRTRGPKRVDGTVQKKRARGETGSLTRSAGPNSPVAGLLTAGSVVRVRPGGPNLPGI